MKHIKSLISKCKSFLYDHPKLNITWDWSWKIIVTILTCFIYAYGFRAFIAPTQICADYWTGDINNPGSGSLLQLVSGGAGGLSQVIIRFVKIFFDISNAEQYIHSALYLVINIPLIIFSWVKISKKFTIITLINVGFVSLFNAIIPAEWIYNLIDKVIYEDILVRTICGGITTGIASGVAMVIGTSAGGGDIVSFYMSEKKSTSAGKYIAMINFTILLAYTIFSTIGATTGPGAGEWNTTPASKLISLSLYSLIYSAVSSVVVNVINSRNKKQELQVITKDENLSQSLIRTFPHACTILNGKGAFSGEERFVLYMVISKSEAKKAINFVRNEDPLAFVTVSDINQVYGKFFIKPIE